MMSRTITILSIVFLLFSCKMKAFEPVAAVEKKKSPVLSSLKESSLPCFKCHSYEKFSLNVSGKFSHLKHMAFQIHCNKCHIIKAHRESTLNKDVCDKCHKLTTFTYDVSGMPASFSHQIHTKKHSCEACHPKLFLMKKGTSDINMDAMYKGNSCGKCHNGTDAFSSSDCNRCHKMTGFKKELSYATSDMAPARFSHEIHTKMFDCNRCHPSRFKYKKGGSGMKMDYLYEGKFCGSCHNGEKSFDTSDCNKCHK